jgi:antibiotic biosynthesis monooxygenase (ABM) superfamily enzyme
MQYLQAPGQFHPQIVRRTKPARYKMFLLTWLGIYPLITAILWVFGSFLSLFPLPLRTLILTGVLVYLMTYIVMPELMKLFYRWLYDN